MTDHPLTTSLSIRALRFGVTMTKTPEQTELDASRRVNLIRRGGWVIPIYMGVGYVYNESTQGKSSFLIDVVFFAYIALWVLLLLTSIIWRNIVMRRNRQQNSPRPSEVTSS